MRKLAFALLLVGLVLVSGCIQQPIPLEGAEITEYEGERLGSIQDFRENSILGPQYINIMDYTLEVSGLVEEPRNYTYQEVLDRETYSKLVTLHCVEGWSVKILWEGVLIEELIDEAGSLPEANTVIFHAYDGYTSSLPLDYIRDRDILLAHKMNGVTLPPERGFPFQVVAEDKYGIKWVKWVTGIELSNNPDYKGYWESRGYSNEADVGGPVFG